MDLYALSQARVGTAEKLQTLLPLVAPEHHERNEAWINIARVAQPPIEDPVWGNLAFMVGVWSRWMTQRPLDVEQWTALHDSLLWALFYEKLLRSARLDDRFAEMVGVITVAPDDVAARLLALGTEWGTEVGTKGCRHLLGAVRELEASPEVDALRERLEANFLSRTDTVTDLPDTSQSEGARLVAALKLVFHLLDRRHDERNRAVLANAQVNPDGARASQELAVLGAVAARGAIIRYCNGSPMSDRHLDALVLLADHSGRHASANMAKEAQRHHVVLTVLREMRQRTADPLRVAQTLDSRAAGGAGDASECWQLLAEIVACCLQDAQQAGHDCSTEAAAWATVLQQHAEYLEPRVIDIFSKAAALHGVTREDNFAVELLIRSLDKRVEDEPEQPDPLDFLGRERKDELYDSIRNSRLPKVMEIIEADRQPLLAALSRELAHPSFGEMLAPLGWLRLPGPANAFDEAKRLLTSTRPAERERALAMFEQASRAAEGRDYAPIAREWVLYARARVRAVISVVAEWDRDQKDGSASWQEIWNLATFYSQMGKPEMALAVLRPGVTSLEAPFAHLPFALYCGIQVAMQGPGSTAYQEMLPFLADHLPLYPKPLCYLAWVLLAAECPTKPDFTTQLAIFGTLVDILARPVELPPIAGRVADGALDDLKDRLQLLRLENTWRLWIQDYARSTGLYRAWELLSEAYERAKDLDRAARALRDMIDNQLERWRERRRPATDEDRRHWRLSITRLFVFYRRTAHTGADKAFAYYYRQLPELWDDRNSVNQYLIGLTRQYLPEPPVASKPPVGAQQPDTVWTYLYSDLAAVSDVPALCSLRTRLDAALDHTAGTLRDTARDSLLAIKATLGSICATEAGNLTPDELGRELDSINRAVSKARRLVSNDASLKPVTALVSACERTFATLSTRSGLSPVPQVDGPPLGGGLSDDVSGTALLVRVKNPGPGDITDVRLSCQDGGIVAPERDAVVPSISEGVAEVIALPVRVAPPADRQPTPCRVSITYRWGILKDLKAMASVEVNWFSFTDHLVRHGQSARDIANPYIYDRPIDLSKDDGRLFQGRERELALVRTLLLGRSAGAPIYFHGIRKVGKTSLLNRIRMELESHGLMPVLVDLIGIDAETQSVPQLVNSFTHKVATAAGTAELSGIRAVAMDHPNPLQALEPFFETVRLAAGSRRVVVMIDDFQLLVGPNAKPILDLLRLIHQRDVVWFMMSGWYRPEVLSKRCPNTELSLSQQPIDFLPLESIASVLRAPVADFGVEIPDETVRHVHFQTAGNPFHIAKIAWFGIARLNSEHRTVLAPQDVDEIAAMLVTDDANFRQSSFSPLILDESEREAATRLAKGIPPEDSTIPLQRAVTMLGTDLVVRLQQKYLIEKRGDAVGIRGRMLAEYLRGRVEGPPPPPPPEGSDHKVGIFVDVENVIDFIPPGMSIQEAGERLMGYAARHGKVVAHWACADRRNLADPDRAKLELEIAGFDVQFPKDELMRGDRRKDEADFLLLERLTEEQDHAKPDIYIIVSGDRDFYARVDNLLSKGFVVRIAAHLSSAHVSSVYRQAVDNRRRLRQAQGHPDSDLFLDDLGAIFSTGGAVPTR